MFRKSLKVRITLEIKDFCETNITDINTFFCVTNVRDVDSLTIQPKIQAFVNHPKSFSCKGVLIESPLLINPDMED